MLESQFQAILIQDIKEHFGDRNVIVLKNDPNYLQGFPDLLILFRTRWAALEVKKDYFSRFQPNQEYYLDRLDNMSFAMAIFPENKDAVLEEMFKVLEKRR